MSLKETLPYPEYKELLMNDDWVRNVNRALNLSNNLKAEGLINYFDKKGYNYKTFTKFLNECKNAQSNSNTIEYCQPTLKVAILVANAIYDNWSHLVTPASDCKILGDILKAMGFIVIYLENLSSENFGKSLTKICSVIPSQSYILFYFAGHGFEVSGKSYMLGIESPSENYTFENGISQNFILKNGSVNNPDLMILLLDMCRKLPDRNVNPDIYSTMPPIEEYEHTCNLIIGYATSPFAPSFEKLCCESESSMSGLQHQTCEISESRSCSCPCSLTSNDDDCDEADTCETESDGIGNLPTCKLNEKSKRKGVSLYVKHLSKHLDKKSGFVNILMSVHRDIENERSEETLWQKPQKLDNTCKHFFIYVEAKGDKEAQKKLCNIVIELQEKINVKIDF